MQRHIKTECKSQYTLNLFLILFFNLKIYVPSYNFWMFLARRSSEELKCQTRAVIHLLYSLVDYLAKKTSLICSLLVLLGVSLTITKQSLQTNKVSSNQFSHGADENPPNEKTCMANSFCAETVREVTARLLSVLEKGTTGIQSRIEDQELEVCFTF